MNTQKKIITQHGNILTPAFLPDATFGTVKSLSWEDLQNTYTESIVTTTLHIEQALTSSYIRQFGGLHKFFGWDRPILTDSGGYQVFSLIFRRNFGQNAISEAGCTFANTTNGLYTFLSPEISQTIQFNLGADIVTVLDVPLRVDATTYEMSESISRNTRWAKRSKDKFLELNKLSESDFNNPEVKRPLIGAVIQGGNDKELRYRSTQELLEIGFDLYNYGGAPIHNDKHWHNDAPKGFNREMIEYVGSLIPDDKIKYAMGVGSPDDIIFSNRVGWDIFDTVLPTRNARHGYLYVTSGEGDKTFENYAVLHVKASRYKFDDNQIDKNCDCVCCKTTSRAYLRHLIRIQDPAGLRLATIHNLTFYQKIIRTLKTNVT